MSKENVEIVRRVYAAVERRDGESLFDLYDPDVEWDFTDSPFRAVLTQDVYRGHDGVRAFIRERYDMAFAEDDLEDLIDAGDHVISVVTSVGRGRTSGAEASREHAGLWTLQNGKVVRVKWLSSRAEALEAVGLSE